MKLLRWLLAGNEWEIEGPGKDHLNLVVRPLARNKVTLGLGSLISQHLLGHGWDAWLAGFITLSRLVIPYVNLDCQSRGLQCTLDGKTLLPSLLDPCLLRWVWPGMRALRTLPWILRRISTTWILHCLENSTTQVPALLFFCSLTCSGEGYVLWSLSMWDRRLGHILSAGRPTHWINTPTSCSDWDFIPNGQVQILHRAWLGRCQNVIPFYSSFLKFSFWCHFMHSLRRSTSQPSLAESSYLCLLRYVPQVEMIVVFCFPPFADQHQCHGL